MSIVDIFGINGKVAKARKLQGLHDDNTLFPLMFCIINGVAKLKATAHVDHICGVYEFKAVGQ